MALSSDPRLASTVRASNSEAANEDAHIDRSDGAGGRSRQRLGGYEQYLEEQSAFLVCAKHHVKTEHG
jgi:hypothetical protein